MTTPAEVAAHEVSSLLLPCCLQVRDKGRGRLVLLLLDTKMRLTTRQLTTATRRLIVQRLATHVPLEQSGKSISELVKCQEPVII